MTEKIIKKNKTRKDAVTKKKPVRKKILGTKTDRMLKDKKTKKYISQCLELRIPQTEISKRLGITTLTLTKILKENPDIKKEADIKFAEYDFIFFKKIKEQAVDDKCSNQGQAQKIYYNHFHTTKDQRHRYKIQLEDLAIKKIAIQKNDENKAEIKNYITELLADIKK